MDGCTYFGSHLILATGAILFKRVGSHLLLAFKAGILFLQLLEQPVLSKFLLELRAAKAIVDGTYHLEDVKAGPELPGVIVLDEMSLLQVLVLLLPDLVELALLFLWDLVE